MSELLDISTQGVLGENKNILPLDSETDPENCHIKVCSRPENERYNLSIPKES